MALTAVVVALVLTGCATADRQAFNRSAHPGIKVVALLEIKPAQEYPVAYVGQGGAGLGLFGAIGGLLNAADQRAKTKEFTDAAKARGLDLSSEFRRQLVAALEARGYRVKMVKAERPGTGFVESYDNLDPEADAFIDAGVWGGYVNTDAPKDYVPSLLVGIRVVKRAPREIVYRERIAYGFERSDGVWVQIGANPEYRFGDYPALMANVPRAVEGLRAGVPKIVAQIERDLSP